MKKSLLTFIFIFAAIWANAQQFPINSNIRITPPYSVFLTDYASAHSEKMVVTLMMQDLSQASLDIKLRISVKGNGITIQTNPANTIKPLTLYGGAPLMISGVDLEPYLHPENLTVQGISDYQSQQLPDGMYQFSVDVYDALRGKQLARTATTVVWLVKNQPPQWVLPQDKSTVQAAMAQSVFFSWMPMHTGSPNSAFSTKYEFSLVELPADLQQSPESYFVSAYPIYSEELSQNFLN